MIKSYVSAIKRVLIDDGYSWSDMTTNLNSLTKACHIINDRVCTHLPIQLGLFELLLFEIQRVFDQNNQTFLETLYKCLFVFCYYGLMRVGEVTESNHVLKACNVHLAKNKNKLRIVLYSSKTHGHNMRPQEIQISKLPATHIFISLAKEISAHLS